MLGTSILSFSPCGEELNSIFLFFQIVTKFIHSEFLDLCNILQVICKCFQVIQVKLFLSGKVW